MSRLICSFLVAVVAVAVLFVAAGCTSDCGGGIPPPPDLVAQWPVRFERQPVTVPGERMRVRNVQVLEQPAWQAVQAPAACAPAYTAPNPCAGGGGTGVPGAIPAERR